MTWQPQAAGLPYVVVVAVLLVGVTVFEFAIGVAHWSEHGSANSAWAFSGSPRASLPSGCFPNRGRGAEFLLSGVFWSRLGLGCLAPAAAAPEYRVDMSHPARIIDVVAWGLTNPSTA